MQCFTFGVATHWLTESEPVKILNLTNLRYTYENLVGCISEQLLKVGRTSSSFAKTTDPFLSSRLDVVNKMTSAVILVIALCALSGRVNCLPCDELRSSGDRIVLDCSSRNISRLPLNTPSGTNEFYLERNVIHTVPRLSFQHMSNLRLLDLSHNIIMDLEKDCFSGLRRLQKLNLHGNRLDLVRLPRDTFAGLPSLLVLAIAGQGTAGKYPVALLDGLRPLRTLSVRGEATSLPGEYGRLPQLTTLDINGGDPRNVTRDMFAAIRESNVTKLVIRHTSITHIDAGAFSHFANLRLLNINCNNLDVRTAITSLGQTQNSSIDSVFIDYIKSRHINVFDMKDFCSDSLFWNNVRRLSLRHVGFQITLFREFQCLSQIEELYLSHNQIEIGPLKNDGTRLFSDDKVEVSTLFRKLRIFDVSYNLNGDGRLSKTRCNDGFDLTSNISDVLPQFPVLQTTANVVNQSASPLPDPDDYSDVRIFKLLANLRYIDISHIPTSGRHNVLKPTFFGSNNVLYLNLSGTKTVRQFDWLVVGLSQLQVVDISHGILEYISDNALRYFVGLRYLNMSNNALGHGHTDFQKAFSLTSRLEDIDLSINGLREIHPNSFAMCTQLQELKLNNNEFDDIHLELFALTHLRLLDLSGNILPYLRSGFVEQLNNLYANTTFELNLRNNDFVCSCDSLPFLRWLQTTPVCVIGKAELSCLYNGSSQFLMNISVSDVANTCIAPNHQIPLIMAIVVVFLLCLITSVLLYMFREYAQVKYLLFKTRLTFTSASYSRRGQTYHVTVIFDVEDDDWRNWAGQKLLPELDHWDISAYVPGRDDVEDNGWPLENTVRAIDQSKKLILCLTDNLLEDGEFKQHLQYARYCNKRSDDYIVISRGNVLLPLTDTSCCCIKSTPRETKTSRVDRDTLEDNGQGWQTLHALLADAITDSSNNCLRNCWGRSNGDRREGRYQAVS